MLPVALLAALGGFMGGFSSMRAPSPPSTTAIPADPCIPPAVLQLLLEEPTQHPGNCSVLLSFSFPKC